jgi:hypothetical protein
LKEIPMTEKENPPEKKRKLKKMDEYAEKIPVAWRFYQMEIRKGEDPRKAELKAVKIVYPGDKNSSTTLRTWKEYGLWPPPGEAAEEMRTGTGRAESRNQEGRHLKLIPGNGGKRRKLKEHTVDREQRPELSEREILQMMRKILDTIEVHHKEWTGGRLKKYSTTKTRVFAGRLPVDLLNEIHKFKGSNTYHLERALRLYVKILAASN